MKRIFLTTLFLCSISMPFAYGADESIESRSNILSDLLNKFETCCVGANNEILDKAMCVDKSSIKSNGAVINCATEAKRLAKMLHNLNNEVSATKPSFNIQTGGTCDVNSSTSPMNNSEANNMLTSLNKIQTKMSDKAPSCSKQTGAECAADMACNLTRSILTKPTVLLKLIPEKSRPKVPKCIDAGQSDCMSEFIAGVLNDIWANVEGVWELGKLAVKGAKSAIVSSWEWATGVEDKTSDAAHLASKQSDSSLKMFAKDPAGFLKKVGIEIWNMLSKSVQNNFGCEEWKGVPHMSACLKPLSSWGCASCNQKMNAVCGVAGVLGGEVVVAYLTGGVVNIAGKVASKGSQGMSKISKILDKSFPKTSKAGSKIGEGVAVVGSTIALPVTKGISAAKKVLNSETSLKILEFTKKAASPVKASAVSFAKTKPIALTLKVMKGVTTPVKAYVNLLDDSFRAGMVGPEKIIAVKYSEAMTSSQKIGDVDELVVPTSQSEGISSELIKGKLQENKIHFDEVKLPDGSTAVKFKMDSSCPLK